jgi:hypothetical protein
MMVNSNDGTTAMGNIATMILVLGGTAVAGFVLLYFSLLSGDPRRGRGSRRAAAAETAALMAAQSAPDRDR